MFTGFLFHLRAHGLKVSLTEWLALIEALVRGHARANLSVFYHLARALLVKRESQFDLYDQAFASFFHDIEAQFNIDGELLKWLENPVLPRELTDDEKAMLSVLDWDTLRSEFEKRLAEQRGRHDGGNRWIGTGGTSPFGHGGAYPAGIRVGGSGGARTAVQVASARRFENLRHDRVLDTRQIGVALRRLRRLARDRGPEELDIDKTIDKSARDGGEIDFVFSPPRSNRMKLLLLVDVGGSMDPHADVCERVFSAAHAASHFRAFRHYFFHNCVYRRLYTDISAYQGPLTADVLKELDRTWTLILVGDAWMSPYELVAVGGSVDYWNPDPVRGIHWLERLRERVPNSVWLNPEPTAVWDAPSARLIRRVFPMFRLTVDGLSEAVDVLRGARPNQPAHIPPPRLVY